MQRGPFGDPNEDYDGDGRIYDDDDACFPGEKAAQAYDKPAGTRSCSSTATPAAATSRRRGVLRLGRL